MSYINMHRMLNRIFDATGVSKQGLEVGYPIEEWQENFTEEDFNTLISFGENNITYTEAQAAVPIEVAKVALDALYVARVYPSIGDQLDMIFHAGLGGDEFQAAIQAVKDANPKP